MDIIRFYFKIINHEINLNKRIFFFRTFATREPGSLFKYFYLTYPAP
ncbi:Uncharacterized protein dnl_21690 [Desulfonema limicola]|uniref:Uncharacterized protein n=1 Tax=Desulfonema limicola TaxID=45656 RepID=A0A975GG38_9BACT|nr:Uncharacterized protein dnl_21690 [Desulfonema limicola]